MACMITCDDIGTCCKAQVKGKLGHVVQIYRSRFFVNVTLNLLIFIKPRLHATSLFWTLCTTDFIKGKPVPLKFYQTHVHFLYRC